MSFMGTHSLEELLGEDSLRWIFVGGKGGVGKTTVACSVAIQLAQRREKVLILSTDPAHNTSDAFKQKFTGFPTLVNGFDNLYAMETDTTKTVTVDEKTHWAAAIPELLNMLPGVDEAISFAEILQQVQTMRFSTIVFDTAPTGHTLRLLTFPDVLQQVLNKLSGAKGTLASAISMVNALSATQSLQADDLIEKFNHLHAVTAAICQLFKDPTQTTFVCVCIPEFLSVYETERLIQELAKQNIDCSNVVVNQCVFPLEDSCGESHDAYGAPDDKCSERCHQTHKKLASLLSLYSNHHCARRQLQQRYLQQISDLYSENFHVVYAPQESKEVRGCAALKDFGARFLHKCPPPPAAPEHQRVA